METRNILEAACDRYRGHVDARDRKEADEFSEGSTSRILSSGLFRSDRAAIDDDSAAIEGHVIDVGEDTPTELRATIDETLKAANEIGVSMKGLRELEDYTDVFRIRLGPGSPNHFEPMRAHKKPGSVMPSRWHIEIQTKRSVSIPMPPMNTGRL